MGRNSKEEEARRAGMGYAFKIAKEQGIDALEEEIKFRRIIKAPLSVPRSEIDRFCQEVKTNCVKTFKVLMVITLLDELELDKDKLLRVLRRFEMKAECICDEITTWQDQLEILEDELDMHFDFDFKDFLYTDGKEGEVDG